MKKKPSSSRRKFLRNSSLAAGYLSLAPPLIGQNLANDFTGSKAVLPSKIADLVKAAFAEGDISPTLGMEQPGNYGKQYHRSFHDPCKVRIAAFQSGTEQVLIVSLDALAVYRPWVDEVKRTIQEKGGIAVEKILMTASHSHSSGPTAMVQPGQYEQSDAFIQELAYTHSSCADPAYLDQVKETTLATALRALENLQEARIGIGSGKEEKVAFNRRFLMKNGRTYTHPGQLNPDILQVAGPIDPEVGVIGSWDADGKCMGCLVNYACHTTTNPGGISANWVYYMEQTIRGAFGPDCVVVFLQGASGDITQVNNRNPSPNPSGEDWARLVGASVGAEVVKTMLHLSRSNRMRVDSKQLLLPLKRRMPTEGRVRESLQLVKQAPEQVGKTNWIFAKETLLLDSWGKQNPIHDVPLQVIQLGPAVLTANPAEFFCDLGLQIKAESPFPSTFPVTMANDCVGYVPSREAFGPQGGGYETRLTSYSNLEIDAGPKIVAASLALIRQLEPGAIPEAPKAPPFLGRPWDYGNVPPERGREL
ncbi:hypothetical protein [Cyclobacterium xiamenense]|uniref:hypothetical protein n=1 Tax=Cyclobacterium xiamenense TaxID=1297121 RepID=UPI000B864955|nr:hypothetical protein [Cyclobacterium xiamenense]